MQKYSFINRIKVAVFLSFLILCAARAVPCCANGFELNATPTDATPTDATQTDDFCEMQTDTIEENTENTTDETADFEWKGTIITRYKGTGGDVQIPEQCTAIGNYAFYGCSNVTTVSIPDSVTIIGDYAFYHCRCLKEIILSNKLELIGKWAFCNCGRLQNIDFPQTVKIIDDHAFSWCTALTSINIPENVEKVGLGAFGGCSNVEQIIVSDNNQTYNSGNASNAIIESETSILVTGCKNTVIPTGVKKIGYEAFYGSTVLTEISLPDGVVSIEDYAFWDCVSLKKVSVPDSLAYIGAGTFTDCRSLSQISFPDNLTNIGDSAFSDCSSLKEIKIPSDLDSIGKRAFTGCNGLEQITVSEQNKTYLSEYGCNAIIDLNTKTLILGCKNTEIPDWVTTIGCFAFSEYQTIEEIHIPDSVTTIKDYAFLDCKSLKKINIPENTKLYGDHIFSRCSVNLYVYLNSYGHQWAKEHNVSFKLTGVKQGSISGLCASPDGKNRVKLTWDEFENADGYLILAVKNGELKECGVSTTNVFVDTDALDSDYNYYYVSAYVMDSEGKIIIAKTKKYVYAKGVVQAVTDFRANSTTDGVRLSWTKSEGADGYLIYGMKAGEQYGYIGMTHLNKYLDKNVSENVYKFYWVFPYTIDKNGKMVVGQISTKYVYGKKK